MSNTIVVISEENELGIVKQLGLNYPVLLTGNGGVNVLTALKSLDKDTYIINVGYCGASGMKIGTAVEIASVNTYHPHAKFIEPNHNLKPLGSNAIKATCITSTDFVTDNTGYENCVFDMELAFICSMFDNVSAIKVVSDNLNKTQYDKTTKEEQDDVSRSKDTTTQER